MLKPLNTLPALPLPTNVWATQVVNGECSEEVAAHDPLCSFPMTKQPWVDSISTLIPLAFWFQPSCPPTLSLCCLSACTHPGSARTKAATTFHCFLKKKKKNRYVETAQNYAFWDKYFVIFSDGILFCFVLFLLYCIAKNRMLWKGFFFL